MGNASQRYYVSPATIVEIMGAILGAVFLDGGGEGEGVLDVMEVLVLVPLD